MNGERTVASVVLLGFSQFERHTLESYLRLAGGGNVIYELVTDVAEADYVVADADHPGVIDIVTTSDRVADAVFIGALAPDGALAWAMRPVDPPQLFREIDAAISLRRNDAGTPTTTSPGTLDAPMRRAGDVAAPPIALVVDDSEIAVRFLQRQLNTLGLRTETAADSTRALEWLSRQRFDVVFLDVELGADSPMDGLMMCQFVKSAHRPPGSGLAPKVIMVSAHDSPTDLVRGTFAGCDAYLPKPLDEQALLRQLRGLGVLAEPVNPKRAARRRRSGTPSTGSAPLA